MKKIVALVLCLALAMALCTVAFAAEDTFDLYQTNSTNYDSASKTLKSGAAAAVAEVTKTEVAAKTNSDGSGNLAYVKYGNNDYVVTTAPSNSSYAVTAHGSKTILGYVNAASGALDYDATGAAFTDFGYKCGQIANPTGADKYVKISKAQAAYADLAGKVVKVNDQATTFVNVLVNGEIVKAEATATAPTAHNWVVSQTKLVSGNVVPAEVTCSICGSKSTAIYQAGKAPAGSSVIAVPGYAGFEFIAGAAGSTGDAAKGVTSAKTFDAGVAMYAGLALMSVAGSAVVIGKKKEF